VKKKINNKIFGMQFNPTKYSSVVDMDDMGEQNINFTWKQLTSENVKSSILWMPCEIKKKKREEFVRFVVGNFLYQQDLVAASSTTKLVLVRAIVNIKIMFSSCISSWSQLVPVLTGLHI